MLDINNPSHERQKCFILSLLSLVYARVDRGSCEKALAKFIWQLNAALILQPAVEPVCEGVGGHGGGVGRGWVWRVWC